jgi:hypothetical protein
MVQFSQYPGGVFEVMPPWKSSLSASNSPCSDEKTTATLKRRRPVVLDHPPSPLARLDRCPAHGQTRNRRRMAPRRLSPLLALAVSALHHRYSSGQAA